jgi:hypothetical protein
MCVPENSSYEFLITSLDQVNLHVGSVEAEPSALVLSVELHHESIVIVRVFVSMHLNFEVKLTTITPKIYVSRYGRQTLWMHSLFSLALKISWPCLFPSRSAPYTLYTLGVSHPVKASNLSNFCLMKMPSRLASCARAANPVTC